MTRRHRVIEGEPIGDGGDEPGDLLGELVPPSARRALQDLQTVAHVRQVLEDIGKRRRDAERGVIDLQEVAPGVYAAPKPQPRRENTNVGRLRSIVDGFEVLSRELHGRRR